MTILEPILYANGALRLTRHGAGKGDTVLLFNDGISTNQFSVPDAETADLTDEVEKRIGAGKPPALVFDELWRAFRPLPKGPNFYHD